MSGMTGSETYFEIKKIKPAQKILLSSGYSLEDEAKAFLENASDGFIQKPFNMKGLSEKIEEILTSP